MIERINIHILTLQEALIRLHEVKYPNAARHEKAITPLLQIMDILQPTIKVKFTVNVLKAMTLIDQLYAVNNDCSCGYCIYILRHDSYNVWQLNR